VRHAVSGRGTCAATTAHAIATLWNPHASQAISVTAIGAIANAVPGGLTSYKRVSTRGTPASTVTPDADNSYNRKAVSDAAPVLDLGAYSVQPTTDGNSLIRTPHQVNAAGGGIDYLPVPITIPAGTGLAVNTTTAAVTPMDVFFEWEDGAGDYQGDAFYLSSQVDALGAAEAVWTQLQNPSTTRPLYVFYIRFAGRSTEAVGYGCEIVRVSGGTTGSVGNTCAIECHVARRYAGLGAIVPGGYTVEPTVETPPLLKFRMSGRSAQSGLIWTVPMDDENGIDLDDCIVVPPLTGLGIKRDAAGVTTTKEASFGWFE